MDAIVAVYSDWGIGAAGTQQENPTTASRRNVKKTCRWHVFSSDRSGYAARREPRGTGDEILRCAQNDRDGGTPCGGRAEQSPAPTCNGNAAVNLRGVGDAAPYGVDGGAASDRRRAGSSRPTGSIQAGGATRAGGEDYGMGGPRRERTAVK
jgi:hypothetical protein